MALICVPEHPVNIDASQVAREPQGNPRNRDDHVVFMIRGTIMPLNLTARFVETVKAKDRREEYRDTEAKGLILRVTPAGVKTWAVLYSHGRRKRRLTLGEFPAIKFAKARELALEALADIAQGHDPQGRKAGRAPRALGCPVIQSGSPTHGWRSMRA